MFTIYERPLDFPDSYVVRSWEVVPGQMEPIPGSFALKPTLEAAREFVPAGLFRMPRHSEDDSYIVETWL